MFSLKEPFGDAGREAGRAERAARHREGAEARDGGGARDRDATADGSGLEGEAAIDDAVEMTFPASDPPAWMSSGAPGSDAAAADRAEGSA